MITFKPITIEDKAEIESFTLPYAPANCDLAFANMFCWQFQFKTAWSVVDGFLVIRFQIGGSDRIGYMQPVGAGDFTPVLRHLEEDILAAGQRLRIIDMTPEGLEKLRSVGHCQFAFASDRNLEDYVYNASDLRDLPGRKYQSKRNHINRFEAEYEYRYEPMTRDHAAECMRLEAEWRKTRSGHTGELSAEQRAMQRAFAHFDRLGLIGGCIYVGDKLVAFTYGSPINDHTFCVHVEKADTEYDGAFTIINREFVAHLPEQYTLIDREEDLGIPGLRQAKLSYHPAFLEKKYTALCLYPDEIACKRLWIKCFGDEETFIDSFLIGHYSRKRMLAAEEDGRLAAMLHLIPFESELGRTTYIYGVATDPDYRGRGLASGLMREAMRRIAEELSKQGIRNIVMHNVSHTSHSFIIADVFKYKGLIVGCPTYNTQMYPEMEALLSKLASREIKGRYLGYFGSFTWASAAVKKIAEFNDKLKFEPVGNPVEMKHSMKAETNTQAKELAKAMADRLKADRK